MDDVQLLEEMLRIRSVSRQEGDLARFLSVEMTRRGFSARIDEVGNAVGELVNDPAGPTIVLLGHMDTVAGDVPVRREGNLLYGRGAVDAKGPLAAFVAASTHSTWPGRLVVIGAVEEESATSIGARNAVAHYTPNYAVVGEPSSWDRVTVGYKGRLLAHYQVVREMAHTAAEGPNVCEIACDFWQELQEQAADINADRPQSAFDRLQPSLRGMRSGSDGLHNTAELDLGFRLPLNLDVAAWRNELVELAGDATISFSAYEPPVRVEKNTPLTRAFLAAIRAEGGQPHFTVKTGTSDLNVIATEWRCPMLAYGPGDSALDHTPHEYIEIDEYLLAIRVLRGVLSRLTESYGR
jgi:LysW-gamma-L-lysine carboxypeptidase